MRPGGCCASRGSTPSSRPHPKKELAAYLNLTPETLSACKQKLGLAPDVMAKSKAYQISWFDEPEEHNYRPPSPISPCYSTRRPSRTTRNGCGGREMAKFKAKDIFRASGLSLLGVSTTTSERDGARFSTARSSRRCSSVRDTVRSRLIIADGYHRLCSVYQFDEGRLDSLQDRLSPPHMAAAAPRRYRSRALASIQDTSGQQESMKSASA
jgi:hypothetical protein